MRIGILCLLACASVACLPSDATLLRQVRDRLDANAAISALQLSVDVHHRVVSLSGATATPEQQDEAMKLARSVEHVKLVVNHMRLNNVSLAEKVRAALAADDLIGKVPILVTALDDTVRLESNQTNADERARANRIAAAVEGVIKVEDAMK